MKLALSLPGIRAETIETVEFYRSEREILSRIGETTVVTEPHKLPRDADLVLSWWWDRSLVAAILTRSRTRAPLLVTGACDIGNPVGLHRARALAKNCASRLTASLAHANLVLSDAEASRLRTWHFPRLHVVPLAVDTDYFRPPDGHERNPFLLLTILQLNDRSVARKGLFRAIRALEQCQDRRFELIVVGEDQGAADTVTRYADTLGVRDRVRLTGWIPRSAKRSLLWSAGLYVQVSSYEGFGYAVAEAMAAGCPTITSTKGSLSELTGGFAYAYADNSACVAEALMRAASDGEALRSAAAGALAHARTKLSYVARERCLRSLFARMLR